MLFGAFRKVTWSAAVLFTAKVFRGAAVQTKEDEEETRVMTLNDA